MTVGTRVQLRNDTAANWTSANPTLLAGEAGIETDTGKFKLGNGTSAWTALSYAGGGGAATPLTTTSTKTGAYTASANERVPVDTTSGAVTITLPTAPADGTVVEVGHIIQGSTNAVTITRGGSSDVFNKAGGSTSVTLSTVNQKMLLTYIASLSVWWVRDALSLASLDARYPLTSQVAPLTNTTPQTATTGAGSAGTASEAMRADAVIPLPAGLGSNQWWGDGSDGAVTLDGTVSPAWASKSGSTYTLTRPIYADTLVVNSGVKLIAPLPVHCKTSLTVNSGGVVCADGLDASGATAGSALVAASPGSIFFPAAAGAAGGTGVGTQGTDINTNAYQGGSTGAGGTGASGAGGGSRNPSNNIFAFIAAGQSGIYPDWKSAPGAFNLLYRASQQPNSPNAYMALPGGGGGGSAGGGDGTNSGGGGGGGGGVLLINAKAIINNGRISANGGAGGTPPTGNCGGGAGGGQGILVTNATSYSGSGTFVAGEGAAGSGVGTGTAATPRNYGVAPFGSPYNQATVFKNQW